MMPRPLRFPRARRWILLALGLPCLWVGSSAAVAWRLTGRLRPVFPEPPPEGIESGVESVRLRTRDGEELGAWFIPGTDPRSAVLLLHGNGDSRSSLTPVVRMLAAAGHAVSQDRFHWQSQSTTSERSPTGRRYIEQAANGWNFLLFVRATIRDPYVALGSVRYESHTGSRPMSILWRLEHPMPAELFQRFATLWAA